MTIASGMEAERVAYAELLARSRQRSIFAEPWWLDVTCGSPDGWRPNLLADDDGTVVAAWPLPTRATRHGLVGTTAPYTPFLGPLLPDGDAGVERVSADLELLERLAMQLADHAHVEAACMPELDYWTPLAWHGFSQTSRTTWRLDAGVRPEEVRAGMRKATRRALAIAGRDGLTVEEGTVDELLEACRATFRQQGRDVPRADVLEALARAAIERGRGEVLAVRTADGVLASAGLFVHDDRWTWNLASGRIGGEGARQAPTMLFWEAIGRALERGTGFDFEGSMLQGVERFVRGFGGVPVAYSVVRRSSPAWARSVAWRRLGKRLLRRAR